VLCIIDTMWESVMERMGREGHFEGKKASARGDGLYRNLHVNSIGVNGWVHGQQVVIFSNKYDESIGVSRGHAINLQSLCQLLRMVYIFML